MTGRKFLTSGLIRSSLLGATIAIIGGCVVRVGPPEYVYHRQYETVYAPAPPVVVESAPPVVVETPAPVVSTQTDPALQQLVAPIALYPDVLIASILPACTYPDQVLSANQWVQSNPGAPQDAIDSQNWDPSIKALAHYPTVLNYMATQPDWVRSLGSAFSENQANVFAAIQDLRAQARNNGNLTSTAYTDVVADGATISIQPADPAYIYVPTYDPVLVYQAPYTIVYGPRFYVGPWFVQGVDWYGGVVFVGSWHGGWLWGPGGWHRDYYFHGYDHRWGHDDRWGPRPFVDRAHWAVRPELHEHGGFRPVVRTDERASVVRAQNAHIQERNAEIRRQQANNHPPANGNHGGEGGHQEHGDHGSDEQR